MYYNNIWEYLNDQWRSPLVEAINKGQKKKAIEIVNALMYKFIRDNASWNAFENIAYQKCPELKHINMNQMMDLMDRYMPKKKIYWNTLPVYKTKRGPIKCEIVINKKEFN